MANIAPKAILKASKVTIRFPENSIILNLSDSSDPNPHGKILQWEYFETSNNPNLTMQRPKIYIDRNAPTPSPDQLQNEVIFSRAGKYYFSGRVTDKGGMSGVSTTIEVTVEPALSKATIYGAHGDNFPDKAALDKIGGGISRGSMFITDVVLGNTSTYHNRRVDNFLAAGIPMVISIRTDHIEKQGDTKIANQFLSTSELPEYKEKLRRIFDFYAGKDVYAGCENEPTVERFFDWSGNAQDAADKYLAQCFAFVEVGKEFGIRTMDGALHVETVNGANTSEGTADKAGLLIAGYKEIDFWGLQIHTSTKTNSYPTGAIPKAFSRLRTETGKQNIGSNEWHVIGLNNTAAVKEITDQFNEAGAIYSIYISGTDPDGVLIDINGNLTPIGRAYRDEITALKQR